MNAMKRLAAFFTVIAVLFSLALAVFAAEADNTFSDVAADAWYAEGVAYCQARGLMSGVSDAAFAPEGTMTCAREGGCVLRYMPDLTRKSPPKSNDFGGLLELLM